MGEVLLARHPVLERQVAIKRLHQALADEAPELVARFQREGRALAALQHHGIVGVHDLLEHRGQQYMVLEYVDGCDLAQLLKRGPLPPDVATLVAVQVAAALSHAHFRRIVHRDIKAANVMISRQGEVKLMDFGVARDESLDPFTKTGLLVGTPMYLAPEVIKGDPADARSDVYAVGALLYHCLSGRRLFEHATAENLYALILGARYPSLQRVSKGIPGRLRAIVRRCLHRDPDRRFQSARDLRFALIRALPRDLRRGGAAERLMAFMCEMGALTEEEATSYIDASALVLAATRQLERRRRRHRAVVWGAVLGALAAGSWWARAWIAGAVMGRAF